MEKTVSLKKSVYDSLMQDIIRGELVPNDIITERSLIDRFSVSKAPVREALIELCKDGFLKSMPRFGYQVVQTSLQEVIELLDVREDLEICNLKRCFAHITPSSLSIFSEHENDWVRSAEATNDIYGNYYRNQHFHLMLCSLSGNRYMYNVLDKVIKDSARFFATYYSSAWNNETESKGQYHHLILEAIKAENLYDACAYLTKDIGAVKEEIRKVIS